MSLHHVVVLTALLISAMSLAGCTGPLPQAVATPAPLTVATPAPLTVATPAPLPVVTAMPAPPAPAETAARYVTYAAGTAVVQVDHPSQTLSFNGAADYDQLTFTTERDASWLCDLTYPKTGVFTVTLKNDRGETIDVLANEAGSGTRQKTIRLAAGNYYFDIRADAPWYIIMRTG